LVEVLFLGSHRHHDKVSTTSLAAAKRLGTRAAAKDVLKKGKQDRSKLLLAVTGTYPNRMTCKACSARRCSSITKLHYRNSTRERMSYTERHLLENKGKPADRGSQELIA
jgi:hypothetical protein